MKPDALYVSTATRTISTAMIFARTLMLKSENIHLSPWYYQTTVKAILSFAQDLPDNLSHVMFVGHNPVSTDICNALLKSGSIDDIPTCGLISLHFPNSTWRTLALNSGELQYYQFPNITK
jgi:phosphohistidine phosphatase